MNISTLSKLVHEMSDPCVTLSLNTHRTHPDSLQDAIQLKNLSKEAEHRLIAEYGKKETSNLVESLHQMVDTIDINQNLDSLHIFLSDTTSEIIRSPLPTADDVVHVGDSFAIKPLIKIFNRTESYLIMVLSQSGVHLFDASNDAVTSEIENDDFPFSDNPHYLDSQILLSDSNKVDNMVREYLNQVDKALVRVFHETGQRCIVICTEDNYSRLMQVADNPDVYMGYSPINYNDTAIHTIAKQAYAIVEERNKETRANAISEMQESVGMKGIKTDLVEIYKAAKEGRGDLLIAHSDYSQPATVVDDYTIKLIDDPTEDGATDDIVSDIAWQVLSMKGRVVFTRQDELNSLGKIALKLRY